MLTVLHGNSFELDRVLNSDKLKVCRTNEVALQLKQQGMVGNNED